MNQETKILISELSQLYSDHDTANYNVLDFVYAFGSPLEAMAYAKLFWPDFIQVDEMIFRSDVIEDANDVKRVRQALQKWNGDIGKTERSFNILDIPDQVFDGPRIGESSVETDEQLTGTLVEMWQARLRQRFPDRKFLVPLYKESDGSMSLTLYTVPTVEANRKYWDNSTLRMNQESKHLLSELYQFYADHNPTNYFVWDFVYAFGSPLEAMAYAKLFWPDFIQVDEMIIRSDVIKDANDNKRVRQALQEWNGDIGKTERKFNILDIPEQVFGPRKGEGSNEIVVQLAETLVEMWKARLRKMFPNRKFLVPLYKESDGTSVTFCQKIF